MASPYLYWSVCRCHTWPTLISFLRLPSDNEQRVSIAKNDEKSENEEARKNDEANRLRNCFWYFNEFVIYPFIHYSSTRYGFTLSEYVRQAQHIIHKPETGCVAGRKLSVYLLTFSLSTANNIHTPPTYIYAYKALRFAGGSARYPGSQARMKRNDGCSRWSNIFGANRRLANAKSSVLEENNPDAACMYVHTSLDMCSDRHVLALLLCAGVISLSCARGTAVDTQRQHAAVHNKNMKNAW